MLIDTADQFVLRREVAVQQRLRHAEPPREIGRFAFETVLGEEVRGGVDDQPLALFGRKADLGTSSDGSDGSGGN